MASTSSSAITGAIRTSRFGEPPTSTPHPSVQTGRELTPPSVADYSQFHPPVTLSDPREGEGKIWEGPREGLEGLEGEDALATSISQHPWRGCWQLSGRGDWIAVTSCRK